MTPCSVQDWLQIIQATKSDLTLARQALAELDDDNLWPGRSFSGPRQEYLLALFTAIRLDQMVQENS